MEGDVYASPAWQEYLKGLDARREEAGYAVGRLLREKLDRIAAFVADEPLTVISRAAQYRVQRRLATPHREGGKFRLVGEDEQMDAGAGNLPLFITSVMPKGSDAVVAEWYVDRTGQLFEPDPRDESVILAVQKPSVNLSEMPWDEHIRLHYDDLLLGIEDGSYGTSGSFSETDRSTD